MSGPPERPRPSADGLWRPALFAAGWIFLAVGIVGLALPLLPGTVFLILSAACFARSSPRFEAWLLNHARLGPPVRRWREKGAIPRPAKVFAVGSMAASWAVLFVTGAPGLVQIGCLLLFCAVAFYIVSRPAL